MIDFRYHLVSLISVFLALAVGIVLGAGPLKESIGDTLTGEVDALRQRAADLRTELDDVTAELGDSRAAFTAASDDLVVGTLDGRRVALVELGGTGAGVLDDISGRITQAGATVTATVRITAAWTDPGRTTFRRTIGATLVEYLDPAPEPDAGTGAELAEALVQGLVTAVPEDPDALAEEAGVLLQLLVDSELIEIGAEVTAPADVVLLVAGPVDDALVPEEGVTPPAADLEAVELDVDALRALSTAALGRTGAAVVAGHALVDGGLLAQLRTGDGTRTRVSTVAEVDRLVGQVSVPLALAERLAGGVGHYGPDDAATAPLPPRVVLPPIVRVPEGDGTTPTDGGLDPGDGTAPTAEPTPTAEPAG